MKLKIFSLLLVCGLISCAELQSLVKTASETPLTKEQVGMGLKEALNIGISEGAEQLAKLNGYYQSPYKILLPEEVQKVTSRLSVIPGFSDLEEKLIERLNRAAEDAASKAKPIFVDAITGMTFADAWEILKGPQNAATHYLHQQTYQPLYDAFLPIITESLQKVHALELWESAITAYNKIPLVNKVNPKLDDYVNSKALVGLFDMVEKKEKAIRTDINERTSDLLRKVFAKQSG